MARIGQTQTSLGTIREVYAQRVLIDCPGFKANEIRLTYATAVVSPRALKIMRGCRDYTSLFEVGDEVHLTLILDEISQAELVWNIHELEVTVPAASLLTFEGSATVVSSEARRCEVRMDCNNVLVHCSWFAAFPQSGRGTHVAITETFPVGTRVLVKVIEKGDRYIAQRITLLEAESSLTYASTKNSEGTVAFALTRTNSARLCGEGTLFLQGHQRNTPYIVMKSGTEIIVPRPLLEQRSNEMLIEWFMRGRQYKIHNVAFEAQRPERSGTRKWVATYLRISERPLLKGPVEMPNPFDPPLHWQATAPVLCGAETSASTSGALLTDSVQSAHAKILGNDDEICSLPPGNAHNDKVDIVINDVPSHSCNVSSPFDAFTADESSVKCHGHTGNARGLPHVHPTMGHNLPTTFTGSDYSRSNDNRYQSLFLTSLAALRLTESSKHPEISHIKCSLLYVQERAPETKEQKACMHNNQEAGSATDVVHHVEKPLQSVDICVLSDAMVALDNLIAQTEHNPLQTKLLRDKFPMLCHMYFKDANT